MSHVSDVKLRIHDLDALETAAAECGLELRRDQKTFAWWGTFVGDSRDNGEMRPADMGKCAHALRIPGTKPHNGPAGPWEIGVAPAKDGDGFKLFYDTFGGAGQALTKRVEQNADKLRREYAFAVAQKKADATLAKRGWTTSREQLLDGGLRLKLRHR